jgi:hypothetical protein
MKFVLHAENMLSIVILVHLMMLVTIGINHKIKKKIKKKRTPIVEFANHAKCITVVVTAIYAIIAIGRIILNYANLVAGIAMTVANALIVHDVRKQ